jgi:hypothetical protein
MEWDGRMAWLPKVGEAGLGLNPSFSSQSIFEAGGSSQLRHQEMKMDDEMRSTL